MHGPCPSHSMRSGPKNKIRSWMLVLLMAAFGLVLWSCNLMSPPTKQSASFLSLYDSIEALDSAIIVFKTEDGKLIDTVYNGRILNRADFQNLVVTGWDGGKAVIFITAYLGGNLAYSVEKHFDGATNTTGKTFVFVSPSVSLTASSQDIKLIEGDSIPLPTLLIKPAELSDKTLEWTVDHPEFLTIGNNYLKALKSGTAILSAKLRSNPTKIMPFTLVISTNPDIPESIVLSADTLLLSVAGASGQLTVKATPSTASSDVNWIVLDGKIASVTTFGIVSGLQKGSTQLIAVSKRNNAIRDSTWVIVSDPVLVTGLSFSLDSTTLFIGGAVENLVTTILPLQANQKVLYSVVDQTKVSLMNGTIKGLAQGVTWVIATSEANPAKSDSLKVIVRALEPVHAVSISPRSLKLFIGGTNGNVTGTVLPSTVTQKVQWVSSNSTIASVDVTGKVTPIAVGTVKIYAQSQADSSKRDSADVTVKRDSPQVSIGLDTVIQVGQTLTFLPVVAPQEYGVVTEFKWDLDGNLVWDSSATFIKSVSYKFDQEKEYIVRFYVRDTEGNETIVSKKIRATKGPTVNFLTPQTSGTYLNRFSTVDISGSSTTPQGPGAIRKITYTVGGVVGTLATNLASNGSGTWFIKGIPLVNNSSVDIKVIATDSFGIVGQSMLSVQMDSTPPFAPILSKPPSPKQTASWTWTPGGGGNGSFQCQLDGGTIATCPTSTSYTLVNPTDGDRTLNVREMDAAGNPSAWSTNTVTIDLQKPTLVLTNYLTTPAQIIDTIKAFTGTASDDRNLRYVQYQIGSGAFVSATGANNWSFTPILVEGTQTVTIRAEDMAGNQNSISMQISYLPKVVFVRKGAKGAGDGTSWADAYPELGPVLVGETVFPGKSQIWVSEGEYVPGTGHSFIFKSNISINGGFAGEGSDRALDRRDLVNNVSVLTSYIGTIIADNLWTSQIYNFEDNFELADFQLTGTGTTIRISGQVTATLKNIICNSIKPAMGYLSFDSNASVSILNSPSCLQ